MAEEAALHADEARIWPVRKVFAWLLGLTLVEVGIVYLPIPKAAVAALLLAGALAKGALVAMHFMHLRIERKFVLVMLAVAAALGAVFVLGLVPDMVLGPGSGR